MIAGTPIVGGTAAFTVQVTDTASPPAIATAALTLTAGGATTTISGTHRGALKIRSGITVITGATINGPVTIERGAVVAVSRSRLVGPVRARGAAALSICGTTIHGRVSISGSTGLVLIGDADILGGSPHCGADAIHGPVALSASTAGFEVGADTIRGPISLTKNIGTAGEPPAYVAANRISGSLSCSGNTPSPTDDGQPNTVRGHARGQCARLASGTRLAGH